MSEIAEHPEDTPRFREGGIIPRGTPTEVRRLSNGSFEFRNEHGRWEPLVRLIEETAP